VLDTSGIDDVDYTAAKMLLALRSELARHGVAVEVVTPHHTVMEGLRRYGLGAIGGRREIYPTAKDALAALNTSASVPSRRASS
jgi:hypothetical protein